MKLTQKWIIPTSYEQDGIYLFHRDKYYSILVINEINFIIKYYFKIMGLYLLVKLARISVLGGLVYFLSPGKDFNNDDFIREIKEDIKNYKYV